MICRCYPFSPNSDEQQEKILRMVNFIDFRKGLILLPTAIAQSSGLLTQQATKTEDGFENLRAYFDTPSDLICLQEFLYSRYVECHNQFISDKDRGVTSANKIIDGYTVFGTRLTKKTVMAILTEHQITPPKQLAKQP